QKLTTTEKDTTSGVEAEATTIVVGTNHNNQVAEAKTKDVVWSHPWLTYFKKFGK
ncbi:hypothetical protein A0J61_09279, partial [Choanephora cucurbitarum]